MNSGQVIYLGIILIFFGIGVSVAWRFASRKQSVPCPFWLSWLVEMDNPFTKVTRAKTIISNLEVRLGMRIIDVGCGPGRLTIPLAEAAGPEGKVLAVDIQAEMLEKVKEKAKMRKLKNIEYIQANVGDENLATEKADRVVLISVLGEIPNREIALGVIYNALKPRGILQVTETMFDPHFQKKEAVLKLAKKAGFKEKKFYGNSLSYSLQLEKPLPN